jgi:hypothetical protein
MQLKSRFRMTRHPSKAEGTVTGKRPENRNHVTYRFVANERTYDAEGAVGDAYETIEIGAKVPVIYDGRNPEVSEIYDIEKPNQWGLASPNDVLLEMFVIASIFSIIAGGIVATKLFVVLWVIDRAKRSLGKGATKQALAADAVE